MGAVLLCLLLLSGRETALAAENSVRELSRQVVTAGKKAASLRPVRAEFSALRRYGAFAASRFQDLEPSQPWSQAVGYLTQKGVLSGTGNSSFRPESPVTRASLLKMLASLSEKEITSQVENNLFSDVSAKKWYAPCVRWSVKEKLLTGQEGGSLRPNGPVTRQELAVILYRFNKNVMGRIFPEQGNPAEFSDAGSLADWADLEAAAVVRAGLMKLSTEGAFRPLDTVSRGEAAQVLYRYSTRCAQYERGCSIDELRYIQHGGGQVNGRDSVSNSREALEEAADKNNKIVELDFSWTTENELVCLHNWGGAYPPQSDLQGFLNSKIYGSLTPICLEDVAEWLRDHPDARIVVDFKQRSLDGLQLIAQRYPDLLEQFYPYLFHTADYETIKAMGYRHIILALYQMQSWEKTDYTALAEFAREHELVCIVASYTDTKIYEPAKKAGVPVVVFTISDEKLMYNIREQGADGFLTDLQDALIAW